MMQIIGRVTRADMVLMQGRGLTPKQAVDALLAEGKRLHPRAVTVVVQKATSHDGFDIVAL
jgi:hypothetical protein